MCAVILPPGGYPIAVKKYISYHIVSSQYILSHVLQRRRENLAVTDLKTATIWNSYDKMVHSTGHKLLLTRNRATSHGKINASGVEEVMWKTDGRLCK
jgi:hypothetical protein